LHHAAVHAVLQHVHWSAALRALKPLLISAYTTRSQCIIKVGSLNIKYPSVQKYKSTKVQKYKSTKVQKYKGLILMLNREQRFFFNIETN